MALAQWVARRALWIVIVALISAVLAVALAVWKLDFVTDRNALIDPDSDFNARYLSFIRDFGDQEVMLLMIGPAPGPEGDPDYHPGLPGAETRGRMKEAAALAAAELRKHPQLFPRILERVPPQEFGGTRMLYLPADDLRGIEQQIQAGRPMLAQVAREPGWPALLRGMRESVAAGGESTQLAGGAADLSRTLAALRQTLEAPDGAPGMPGLLDFKAGDPALDEDGYLFAWEGRLLMVPILPHKDLGALNQVARPLEVAREMLEELRPRYPDLAIALSGRPVIYSDEMASTSRDMTRATLLALACVALVFVVAFRSVLRPLLAVAALMLALCWTFGATTLLIGHLNIFAMVFAVVLVGLGIDFGIHLLSHYRNALGHGLSVREALVEVYAEVGMGTVLGALTTATALSTAVLTDFLGLAELGLICGMGIILCLAAMLVVFPALLVLVDARRLGEGDPALRAATRGQDALPPPPPRPAWAWATGALIVMCLAAAAFSAARGWVPFDYNLMELNDPSSRALDWERLLIRHDQRASFAVSIQPSLADVARVRAELEPLRAGGLVRGFDSMAPQDEAEKREILARVQSALPPAFADAAGADAAALRSAARALQAELNQAATRGPEIERALAPALEELRAIVALVRDRPAHVELRMAQTEGPFFGKLGRALADLARDAEPPGVTAATLPEVLRRRYVGRDPQGRELHALYIYPAKDAWERDNAREFTHALRAVDPGITGVTVQVYEAGEMIVKGFVQSVLYAFIAIVLLLLLDLRRPLAVAVALLPLFGAGAVLLGVMTISDLQFNFANFFAVPILVGISVDAGVYLVHSQRHGDPVRTVQATRRACLLCGLTTLIGFGMLVFASHRGVVSLGVILSIGCTAGTVVSYFVVPAILGWFNRRGRRL